jgi:coenzyme PQQ precursor peptide PqqA
MVGAQRANIASKGIRMSWTTPRVVEISVGMEINCYACADI